MRTATTIHPLTVRALARLEDRPKIPLKGKGHKRIPFPWPFTNRLAKETWEAIPEPHKCEVATSRRQKGYFGWDRFISPEAARKARTAIRKLEDADRREEEQRRAQYEEAQARAEARKKEGRKRLEVNSDPSLQAWAKNPSHPCSEEVLEAKRASGLTWTEFQKAVCG